MSIPKIVVTGANGQLGNELQDASSRYPQYKFIFASRAELPVDQPDTVRRFIETHQPAFCINCAAYTAVDKAETEKEMAFQVNAEAVGVLAAACKAAGSKLIHISTDYVFDGNSSTPLLEGDAVSPVNVYGASKLKGEELAFGHYAETIILRTSWVYSVYGNNFVKTMMRLMRERESINVINDQCGSPTYAADLANIIMQITDSGKFIPGIYNYSNEGQITWFDFAVAIKDLTNSDCIINPIPGSQYPTPAKRPHFSLLDKSKIKSVYGAVIPEWRTSLISCIEALKNLR